MFLSLSCLSEWSDPLFDVWWAEETVTDKTQVAEPGCTAQDTHQTLSMQFCWWVRSTKLTNNWLCVCVCVCVCVSVCGGRGEKEDDSVCGYRKMEGVSLCLWKEKWRDMDRIIDWVSEPQLVTHCFCECVFVFVSVFLCVWVCFCVCECVYVLGWFTHLPTWLRLSYMRSTRRYTANSGRFRPHAILR